MGNNKNKIGYCLVGYEMSFDDDSHRPLSFHFLKLSECCWPFHKIENVSFLFPIFFENNISPVVVWFENIFSILVHLIYRLQVERAQEYITTFLCGFCCVGLRACYTLWSLQTNISTPPPFLPYVLFMSTLAYSCNTSNIPVSTYIK